MDARGSRLATVMMALICMNAIPAMGAEYRTKNFIVNAPTGEFAEQVGKAAEYYREKLAVAWLGKPLPGNWSSPCPITVRVGQLGAGGRTSFQFDRGEVFGWRMNIEGTEERIIDSVLPHEISHMIFASHFRRPLPRWADEGAATLIEHESERRRQQLLLNEVMEDGSKFPLRQLLAMKEYPQDHRRVLTLYAQGYSLADYLIQKKGRRTFLKFLDDAHNKDWDSAIRTHYKMNNTASLESKWGNWIMAGSPRLNVPQGELLAGNSDSTSTPSVVRGQAPDKSSGNSATELGAASSEADLETAGLDSETSQASEFSETADLPETPPTERDQQPDERAVAAIEASIDESASHSEPMDENQAASAGASVASKAGLQEYQIRGRRAAVLAGWEPATRTSRPSSVSRGTESLESRTGERPPFVGGMDSPDPERPPFVDDSRFVMSN